MTDDDPNRVPGADLVLRGIVVRDGAPVAGATVTVTRAYPVAGYSYFRWQLQQYEEPAPPVATTGSGDDGRFELRIPRRSRLIVSAFRAGAGAASLSLLMPAAGDPAEITLDLRPGSVLRGEVVDAEGAPVAGAEIRLRTSDWTRPIREVATATGEEGRFEIADIADGSYSLLTGSPRHPVVRTAVSVPAQSFVRVVLRDAGVVAGTVRNGRGEPVAGALLFLSTSGLQQPGGDGRARGETDANGEFRIEVFPGAITGAAVEHPRFGRHVAGPEGFPLLVEVVESGAEVRYDIRLRPGVPLRGRVVHADTGAPAPGAAVTLLRLMLQWRGLSDLDAVRAGEDGRFEFPYVTEGTYALEAKAGHAARLVVRYAQQGEPFTIDLFVDGENVPPEQRIELLPAGAVRGVLVGAEARPGAQSSSNVFLATQAGQLNATPDDRGHFAFEHVPPMENAVAQSYGPQAKSDPFRVVAGETTEIVLDPSGQGGIPVLVEDEQGRPLAGVRLALLMEQQLRQSLQAFMTGWSSDHTDESGRATVSSAMYQNDWSRGQAFVVLAQREGYEVALSKSFKLTDAPTGETLRIVLRRGGTVRGRVEFAGGGPAANVWVSVGPKRDPNLAVDPRTQLT
ncbi:MAG: carboxypeptidase regulatory-like domain-containing protein, partial [Synechococcaceae cyanobacterium]|nr:carboxypeptidase regulatory-like domain-containing protein [Synechococcaceae cyanobacterium]